MSKLFECLECDNPLTGFLSALKHKTSTRHKVKIIETVKGKRMEYVY